MTHSERTSGALRTGISGAALAGIGVVLSGPLGLIAVDLVHGQPAWQGVQTFVANFHPVQTAPFFGGILLVLGFVILIAALYQMAAEGQKARLLAATVLTGAFATLIIFNYVNQAVFLPALAREYKPEYEPLVIAFSFANPDSLCWAIEMWGYGLLGLATWLAAPVFGGRGVEKAVRMLMVTNGIVSIAGAGLVSWRLAWVFTPTGLLSYAAWNVLVLALVGCTIVAFRRRQRQEEGP